jgi:hypothetical protein
MNRIQVRGEVEVLGSARASRAGAGAPPARTFFGTPRKEPAPKLPPGPKVRCGEAPQPAREGACAPQIADRAVADFQVTAY